MAGDLNGTGGQHGAINPFMSQLENFDSCVVQVTRRGMKEESAKKLSVCPWASNFNSGNGKLVRLSIDIAAAAYGIDS